MDRGRLEAFSDGVFSVAITLLALNLVVAGPGHGPLASQLTNQWPAFVAYAISFFTIGIIWVNHHALCRGLASVDRPVVFLNLLLLFFVVAIPFATAVFGGVFLGMSLGFGAVFTYIVGRRLLAEPLSPSMARTATVRFTIGAVAYAIAIGIAFLSTAAALAISAAVALYYIFERTPATTPAAGTSGNTA